MKKEAGGIVVKQVYALLGSGNAQMIVSHALNDLSLPFSQENLLFFLNSLEISPLLRSHHIDF